MTERMVDSDTDVPFEVWASRLTGALPGALRRVPFTASVVLVTLVTGLVARTVWTPIWREAWFHQVAYGLPGLREGRIWTLLTGWFFYLTPGQYLSGLILFAVVVGACEMRLGAASSRSRPSPARSVGSCWRRCWSGPSRRPRGRGRWPSHRCAMSASPPARSPFSP